MVVKLYLYPEGIDFRKAKDRIVYKSKMRYLYDLDIKLTIQKEYSRKQGRYFVSFPPELNNMLENLMEKQMLDKDYNFYLYGLPKFIFEVCCNDKRLYFHNNPWFVGEVFIDSN